MATPALSTGLSAETAAPARSGTPALVGTLCALVAGAMFTTGVTSAYLSVRNATGASEFVPVAMPFNNYVAVMIASTLILASIAAGWAVTSMRLGNRRYASTGFGLAAFLGIATLNLIWFLGVDAKLSVDNGAYTVLFYAMLATAVIMVVIGLVSSLIGMARVLGGQATARQPHYALASAWGQHLALASWFAIYMTAYWLK
jgi:heme/copper-type cytochrome/quinol oxidase subunit 3